MMVGYEIFIVGVTLAILRGNSINVLSPRRERICHRLCVGLGAVMFLGWFINCNVIHATLEEKDPMNDVMAPATFRVSPPLFGGFPTLACHASFRILEFGCLVWVYRLLIWPSDGRRRRLMSLPRTTTTTTTPRTTTTMNSWRRKTCSIRNTPK